MVVLKNAWCVNRNSKMLSSGENLQTGQGYVKKGDLKEELQLCSYTVTALLCETQRHYMGKTTTVFT